jgi:ribonucleoside-diphosphate reductase alpha chain
MAKSVVDYIFRWLGMTFIEGYREANAPKRDPEPNAISNAPSPKPAIGNGGTAKETPANPNPASLQDGARRQGQDNAPATAKQTNGNGHTPKPHTNGNGHHQTSVTTYASRSESSQLLTLDSRLSTSSRSEQFAHFQSDAPACDNCGAITVRNGNCYLCHNCGQSMGCS